MIQVAGIPGPWSTTRDASVTLLFICRRERRDTVAIFNEGNAGGNGRVSYKKKL